VKSTSTHYTCQNLTQNLQHYSGIQKYNFNLKLAAPYQVHIHEHIRVEKHQSFSIRNIIKGKSSSSSLFKNTVNTSGIRKILDSIIKEHKYRMR